MKKESISNPLKGMGGRLSEAMGGLSKTDTAILGAAALTPGVGVMAMKKKDMTKKAQAIMEKIAKVFGADIPTSVYTPHPGIEHQTRVQGLKSYYKAKSREGKTSWPTALGTGAAIGGIGGGLLGLVGQTPKSALIGASIGAVTGAGIGAITKKVDDQAITETRRVLKQRNAGKILKEHLNQLMVDEQEGRDWNADRKHREVLEALKE